MVKLLAPILLQSSCSWKARDLIMSDIFAIVKSEEMLENFEQFFTNDPQDHLDQHSVDSLPKFQMCDPDCVFLTTADE